MVKVRCAWPILFRDCLLDIRVNLSVVCAESVEGFGVEVDVVRSSEETKAIDRELLRV